MSYDPLPPFVELTVNPPDEQKSIRVRYGDVIDLVAMLRRLSVESFDAENAALDGGCAMCGGGGYRACVMMFRMMISYGA
jgi:hypothetical protein